MIDLKRIAAVTAAMSEAQKFSGFARSDLIMNRYSN